MSGYALIPIEGSGRQTGSNLASSRCHANAVDLERIVALSFHNQLSISLAPISPQFFDRQSDDYVGIRAPCRDARLEEPSLPNQKLA